ncbi:scavenger receptor cysteine-rich domain-containing group B protein [Tachyglossus aculeatus]|uniref:scavenger receptor cysteine-rich domain-containing group B protein n=1 Tax=Tachyglossus aculeatus TaxID=9261 RepID=UPI0018F2C429|nr:scavenger receptor cysteine-rich domain-containing group B protein [Tachyglossus aculeatus]
MRIGPCPVQKNRAWSPPPWTVPPFLLPSALFLLLLLAPPAGTLEPTPLPFPEVRLASGRNRCQGRVEILHNGSWGTVCDDDWDLVDANVVCRQLGCGPALPGPAALAFGQGRGPILLDNVDCEGREAALSQCGSHGWGVHNCYHYEDVAVVCNELLPTWVGKVIPSRAPPEHAAEWEREPGRGRDGSLRLAGGGKPCQGRVEILHRGTWGTVCDDDWGLAAAAVACRQLGCGRALAAKTNAFFGYGTGLIALDNVNCEGGEPRLDACPSLGWGIHNCGHHEDAGVVCSENGVSSTTKPPISATQDHRDALTAASTVMDAGDQPSPGTEPPLTAQPGLREKSEWERRESAFDAHCQGRMMGIWALGEGRRSREELTLLEDFCLWGGGRREPGAWGAQLRPGVGTGLRPRRPLLPARAGGGLRLVNGHGSCQGRVEVLHPSGWGTVCDDDWGFLDAQVACRQAGCGPALGATVLGYFGYGTGPVLLDNVDCTGREARLGDCFHLGWGQHNCGHHEDAGVICRGPEEAGDHVGEEGPEATTASILPPRDVGHLRLANGSHRCEGRVELFLQRQWGTVCDDAWDLRAVRVVCRQLGCGSELAARGEAHFGPGAGLILLDNVKCKGDEASLLSCSHIRWDVHNCDHSEDAGALCRLR